MIDFKNLKKLTIGGVELKQLFINGIQVWKAVSYTNLIPISTDASGAAFSDTGYVTHTSLNSDGTTGYYWDFETTGFMPCKVGDIVRLKSVGFSKTTNSGSNRIVFYNSSKAVIKSYNGAQTYDPSATVDSNGNWTQFKVPSTAPGCAYFRLCCNGITESSIITVNEEITD